MQINNVYIISLFIFLFLFLFFLFFIFIFNFFFFFLAYQIFRHLMDNEEGEEEPSKYYLIFALVWMIFCLFFCIWYVGVLEYKFHAEFFQKKKIFFLLFYSFFFFAASFVTFSLHYFVAVSLQFFVVLFVLFCFKKISTLKSSRNLQTDLRQQ